MPRAISSSPAGAAPPADVVDANVAHRLRGNVQHGRRRDQPGGEQAQLDDAVGEPRRARLQVTGGELRQAGHDQGTGQQRGQCGQHGAQGTVDPAGVGRGEDDERDRERGGRRQQARQAPRPSRQRHEPVDDDRAPGGQRGVVPSRLQDERDPDGDGDPGHADDP